MDEVTKLNDYEVAAMKGEKELQEEMIQLKHQLETEEGRSKSVDKSMSMRSNYDELRRR